MSGVLKAKVGGVWVPIMGSGMTAEVARWNSAWGVLATAPLNSTYALTTTQAALATLTAVPTVAGRRYVVHASWRTLEGIGAATSAIVNCWGIPGDTSFHEHYVYAPMAATGYGGGGTVSWRFDGTGAPVTLQLTAQTYAGTGNMHAQGGSSSHFWIEDVGPVSFTAPAPPDPTPAWTPFTFLNGWANLGNPWQGGGYRKIGDIVYLRGLVARGSALTANTPLAIATLPAGYRPLGNHIFTASCAGVSGYGEAQVRLEVMLSGDVEVISGSPATQVAQTYTSLAGIQFSMSA